MYGRYGLQCTDVIYNVRTDVQNVRNRYVRKVKTSVFRNVRTKKKRPYQVTSEPCQQNVLRQLVRKKNVRTVSNRHVRTDDKKVRKDYNPRN